jgi:hypothetical protein
MIVIKQIVHIPLKKPKCEQCKYYSKQTHGAVCKLFKYNFAKEQDNYYLETDLARTDPALCGPYGIYFKEK